MLVKIIRSQDDVISVKLAVTTLRQILSGLELHYGKELIDSLLNDGYRYVLVDSHDPDRSIAISPDVMGGSFDGYDMLVIVRDINGELPVALVAAAIGLAETSMAAIAITAVINIGLSLALNAVMSLLSPTPEYSSDPGKVQKSSNLFNGSQITREQGGIVPIILGNPYCSGVLISSGISTEDY